MLRAKRGGLIYRGDLYIRAWQLQSESRRRAHQHQGNICLSVSNLNCYMYSVFDPSAYRGGTFREWKAV